MPGIIAIAMSLLGGLSHASAGSPVFKTADDTRPGDWVRYERTTEGSEQMERQSLLLETLSNDGGRAAYRITFTDLDSAETRSIEVESDTSGTIEGSMFESARLCTHDTVTKAPPGRETLTVAGRSLDCAVLSATASPRKGVIGSLFKGLSSGTVTEGRMWYSPEVPFLGMVKRETVTKLMRGREVQLSSTSRTELKEWGDASRPPAR